MESWSAPFFDGVLALVALWGAMRLYGERARPGMIFGAVALFSVFIAAVFGTLRYAGLDTVAGINDGLSLISAIVAPTWAITAAIFIFRGGQDKARTGVLWIVPIAIAALAFLPQTALLGETYAQIAGLAMVCVLVGVSILAAIKGRTWPGAALAISAAGYAFAALATLGVAGGTEVAALNSFHIGIAIWAGAFARGLPEATGPQ
ncbi:hypothetical protein [Parvibaculum sp.]|jgi:hypothetical protein|uniref:hypothetical protein n=1 Tax=Parvibaculum sp. TaxID=2024848 RepID=UPI000C67C7A6|nr:hypothetical protein [Parvibaculum sp.]MAM93973.1 hypothetical protein [Parvibaculum sp.]